MTDQDDSLAGIPPVFLEISMVKYVSAWFQKRERLVTSSHRHLSTVRAALWDFYHCLLLSTYHQSHLENHHEPHDRHATVTCINMTR